MIRKHRKDWEFAISLVAMDKCNLLSKQSTALGVGSGHERILYFLTNHINKVIATDLYGNTPFSGNESNPDVLMNKDRYAPFAYEKDKLEFINMDGTNLNFDNEKFDIVFSFSSIEHFGGMGQAVKSLNEMKRVCKKGGLITIVSEYLTPFASQNHPEFFTKKQIEENFLNISGLSPISDFDWQCDEEKVHLIYPSVVDRAKRKICNLFNIYPQYPYTRISDGKCIWTSFHMGFIKE